MPVKRENVLRKEPMGMDIGEKDTFQFSDSFASKFYKVKIGTMATRKKKRTTHTRLVHLHKYHIRTVLLNESM